MVVRAFSWVAAALASILVLQRALGFPLGGEQTALPAGTELNEDALDHPREVFHSEAIGGRKSYLVNLGDLAFNSPDILGGPARQAGVSCGTCHVDGASNPKFFIPGLSTRPGNFDTSGPLFNPAANNFALDPVRIPSLRGSRYLAPYGHDGRTTSLRDFIHDVIVVEFAGPESTPEPSPRLGLGRKKSRSVAGTVNTYQSSGTWVKCNDPTQPGVAELHFYLASLHYYAGPNCAPNAYYATRDADPPYSANGTLAAATATTMPPLTQRHIGDELNEKKVPWAWYSGGFNFGGRRRQRRHRHLRSGVPCRFL